MGRSMVEAPASNERRSRMSDDEWLRWNPAGVRSEWVDGEVVILVSTSRLHGRLVWFLAALLGHYVQFRRLDEVQTESMAMRLERTGRVPDIFFVATDHLDRLTPTQLLGPADLVVEVVSEESPERDRVETFAEYAAAGIPEYWVVDSRSDRDRAEFFRLVDGVYQSATPDVDGRYHSVVVPGFWLRPAWLEQDPLPDALDCLFEIAPDLLAAKLRSVAGRDDGSDSDGKNTPVG